MFGPLALGHVQADADHAERLAVVAGKHLPRTGDPVDAAVLPDVAELDVKLAARLQRLSDGGVRRLPIIGMDELLEVVERAAERTGGEAVQRFEAVGPLEVAGADIPIPHAHAPGFQGQPQPFLADGERLPCLPQFGNVRVRSEPVQDLPALADERVDPCEEGTELAVRSLDREHHVERLAAGDGRLPALQNLGQHVGVVDALPAPAFHLCGGRAGVLVPAAVVPEDVTVRPRRPRQLRDRVGQEPQFLLALPQCGLLLLPLGVVVALHHEARDSALVVLQPGDDRCGVRITPSAVWYSTSPSPGRSLAAPGRSAPSTSLERPGIGPTRASPKTTAPRPVHAGRRWR